jgi:hypothetical protein
LQQRTWWSDGRRVDDWAKGFWSPELQHLAIGTWQATLGH